MSSNRIACPECGTTHVHVSLVVDPMSRYRIDAMSADAVVFREDRSLPIGDVKASVSCCVCDAFFELPATIDSA